MFWSIVIDTKALLSATTLSVTVSTFGISLLSSSNIEQFINDDEGIFLVSDLSYIPNLQYL